VTPSVLIVDDSLTVRMDLGDALRAAGLAPTLCATAAQAREELSAGSFSLLVLDVMLPDADGIDLLHEIKAAPDTARIPVMLLSAEAEVRDRVRGVQTGADEYVGKPYDTTYVVARAKELIPRTDGRAAGAPGTVLVVDDSVTFREQLRAALVTAGYQVVTAATGEEGLRLAADVRPGAVLVDGVLPGIDGATVVRRLRLDAALRRTPCLLLTASEDPGAELRALDSGADDFARKEEDVGVILARLAAVMRGAGSRSVLEATSSGLGPKRVLAVDDSLTYLEELAAQLRREGYDVVLARSGEEALELLGAQRVDCILLDLLMPGLSGQETCRRIKGCAAWRDTPLVMLTALEEREAMIEGINSGADDYVPKSSDFEVLKARVRGQLRRKQFEDESRHIQQALLRKEMEAAEARAARELAETRAALLGDLVKKNAQLAEANAELESFSYSVSHDLRAPLRAIDGFSQALLEDFGEQLGDKGQGHLRRVRTAAQRMAQLIDDLLKLSRVTRTELRDDNIDLSALAGAAAADLERADPDRKVDLRVEAGLAARGDTALLRIVLDNLLGNAWKYTARTPDARIEFGATPADGAPAFFVRDNGAGFDMTRAGRLFTPFCRLHAECDFPGTGIGLATVRRIVQRHGGRVWAEAAPGAGATFHFTLPAPGDA
jgi:two-component system, NtrC family, sensor kinase